MTASNIFYWVREFIRAARETDVKTVVPDKRRILSPLYSPAQAKRIREFAPIMSGHIFVRSERQRKFWNSIGVDDPEITVIGQPRSDLLFRERQNSTDCVFHKGRPLVTPFSYMDDACGPVGLVRTL